MKKLLIFVAAALFFVGGTAFAQDSYRQKVETFVLQGGELSEMQQQIQATMEANVPAEAFTDAAYRPLMDYIQNELLTDILDAYEVALRQYVSEEELDELIAWMALPESQAVRSKEKALAQRIQDKDPEMLVYVGAVVNGMIAVMGGEKPDPMYVSSASPEYKAAFHEYFEASSVAATLKATFENLLGLMSQSEQNAPDKDARLRAATDFMLNNMEPMMLLMTENVYTIDELRYYTAFFQTQAYQHQAKAGALFASSVMEVITPKMLSRLPEMK